MGRPPGIVCLALAALLSCGTSPKRADEPSATGKVVLFRAPTKRERPRKSHTWFRERIRAARAALEEGRLEEGLALVYEARRQRPAPDQDQELLRLLHRMNQAVLELDTVRGRMEPGSGKGVLVFGEPIRVKVRLHNPTPRPVHIPARRNRTSGSVWVIDIVRTEYDIHARIVTTRRRIHRPVDRDIDLEPGETAERVLDLGRLGNDRSLDGFRNYTVGGLLRPAVLELGGLRRWEPVRLESTELRSFRPNYEQLASDPVARIGQAIEKRAPVHLLTAAALVPPDRRQAAVDLLVKALRRDRPIDGAIFSALRYLTGVELGHDVGAWRAWWPRVRATFFPASASVPEDSEKPRFGE